MTEQETSPSTRIHLLRQYERQQRFRQLFYSETVTLGSEEIPNPLPKHLPNDYYLSTSRASSCYHCDASNHSQHFCPLMQCTSCFRFGHSQRVCPRMQHHRLPPRSVASSSVPRSRFFRLFRKS